MNLQNLPSNSTLAKIIKECFGADDGWIYCGADFNALESVVNTLTTKDTNKIKKLSEGYDDHCFNTYHYWPEKFTHLELTPQSVNSIEITHKADRQDSKPVTFALQYLGTPYTLVTNAGFEEEEAIRIYNNYHELYKESDQWLAAKLESAFTQGYVTLAFGLKLRTPRLHQSINNPSLMTQDAQKEYRTAGNALTQSYGLLNNRAAVAFMKKVKTDGLITKIRPVALIHDAIYLLIKDEVEVVRYVNTNLIKSMEWQELEELRHDVVKLGSNLALYHPNWCTEHKIKNYISSNELRKQFNRPERY